ncbi:hypothetical protein NPIL_356801 [Nephila pilipes]|uniref:Uncharacterized protein n=1 Tax=Nephila pilipes TaxID=299642 RepID=A0A8X6MUG1_NEPPI|nr:hypothetical protein NPIL_337171 [Nephila pilipes]GFS78523.1 hypothetical protein NPIL_196891 [Nephila pilipes]GFT98481.1 hypothetical protein NPIL_462861 [Nephila pilipes]GFU41253.1 hypothetical protein NPIL_356801 [Nephila pilipes]
MPKKILIGSRKRAEKPTGRDSQLNLHFGRQNKEHTLLALKEGPVFRVRSMPQRLQCKRVWKGKVEKNNYTFSYPFGKEPPSEFIQLWGQLCQNLVPETSPATRSKGSVFTLAYLLCRNGTLSELCHKYPSTTFVREQLLGDEICRSRILTLIRTDKKCI